MRALARGGAGTPRRPAGPFFRGLAFLAVLFLAGTSWAADTACVPTRGGRRACVEGALFLRVPLTKKGQLAAAAKRYTGDAKNASELERANPLARKRRLTEARIPLELLTPDYAEELLAALFPEDRRTAQGWEHAWGKGPKGARATWSDVARWFAGSRTVARNLQEANRDAGRHPAPGTRVLVPDGLLSDAIRDLPGPAPPPGPGLPGKAAAQRPPAAAKKSAPAVVGPPAPGPFIGPPAPGQAESPPPQAPAKEQIPAPPAPPPAPVSAAGPAAQAAPELPAAAKPPAAPAQASPLTYGHDEQGGYAVYRLQAGEALYSAVAVRFTGTVSAEDVNALAMEIAKRSGIRDVTGIPVGFPVKIPLDDLLPQYLPPTDARYQAWAKNQAELGQITNTYKNSVLDGVVVILDSGHGGLDRGAMAHGVWEDSYVYDITCRIREALERRTKARVLMTLLDPDLGYRPQDKRELAPNRGAVILTHPWFRQTSTKETKVEVNLRWHLANQYFERLRKEGVDPQRVVFTSVHADSLHPSLRGTMFYVPGNAYRSNRWCSSGDAYERFQEYRAQACYTMSDKELRQSEGLSLQLAKSLEEAFEAKSLTLHPYSPTRDHVIRGRRSWVPAVLRNSIIPCSILVEVCNLNNAGDAKLIADPAFRQAVAEAYVDALVEYYS